MRLSEARRSNRFEVQAVQKEVNESVHKDTWSMTKWAGEDTVSSLEMPPFHWYQNTDKNSTDYLPTV